MLGEIFGIHWHVCSRFFISQIHNKCVLKILASRIQLYEDYKRYFSYNLKVLWLLYVYKSTLVVVEVLCMYIKKCIILGEKPANVQTRLRFGLHWHIDTEEKRIIEGYGIFDLPGFFIQGGVDLFKRAHDEQAIEITLLKDSATNFDLKNTFRPNVIYN